MGEPGRTAVITDWWRGLSGAWRANVGLYGLATLALVALVAQIATGRGEPQRVEVASRAPVTSAPPVSRIQPTTTAGPTTTVAAPPTTVTLVPAGPVPPTNPAPPVPLSVDRPVDEPTTVPGPVCMNSSNPACGAFFWDPPPAPNQGLTVSVSPSTANPTTTDPVTFTVTVSDPDHRVTDNCAVANFGDGSFESRVCTHAPCADAHGAWETPPAVAGNATFTFSHVYQQAGSPVARFTFHTDFDAPCPNPYGSTASGETPLMVQ